MRTFLPVHLDDALQHTPALHQGATTTNPFMRVTSRQFQASVRQAFRDAQKQVGISSEIRVMIGHSNGVVSSAIERSFHSNPLLPCRITDPEAVTRLSEEWIAELHPAKSLLLNVGIYWRDRYLNNQYAAVLYHNNGYDKEADKLIPNGGRKTMIVAYGTYAEKPARQAIPA